MKLLTLTAALLMGLVVVSCGSSTDCHKADACACAGAGTCEWNCVEAGCAFTNSGQGLATLTCPSGGCSLTASGQGDTNLSCAGGGCTVTASAQGAVNLACAGGGCSVSCGGQGTCTITQCPNCTCTETALTATCSVQ